MRNLLGGGNNVVAGVLAAPPVRLSIVKGTSFTQVTVANYGLLVPVNNDGTTVLYRPVRDSGNAIANSEVLQGRNGVCPLPASGSWWVSPQTNIAAGVYNMLLIDFPTLEAMLAMMQALTLSNPGARTMSGATFATVTNASTSIIAANAARALLILTHTGTTDGTTATTSTLDLNYGAAAVVGSGTRLSAGMSLIFDVTTGITLQEVRGISSAGNIRVGIQEAT